MSQAKVERYKKEKANRKQMIKKQRRMDTVRKCVLAVAGIAVIAWLAFSAYNTIESNQEREIASINYEAVDTYLEKLSEE
ncbi:MAG: hypothetical protein U0L05_01530 [Schaedlerella sp.]|nr:hypothetical protein [Schaedlerella sp.]